MAHSANTFRDRAATYESMKRYVIDERALQILDDLAAKNVARAGELEALAVPRLSLSLSLAPLSRLMRTFPPGSWAGPRK
jgi:hypothetical protein